MSDDMPLAGEDLCEWRLRECGRRETDLVAFGEHTRDGLTTLGTMRDMLDELIVILLGVIERGFCFSENAR